MVGMIEKRLFIIIVVRFLFEESTYSDVFLVVVLVILPLEKWI